MRTITLCLFIATVGSLLFFTDDSEPVATGVKINGINLVAPRHPIATNELQPLLRVNASWVAVVPYAFMDPSYPEVKFRYDQRWWGEGINGVAATVRMAKELGMKAMIKPHIWVGGQGWAGDFTGGTEENWGIWEHSYERYILALAAMADSVHADIFCIGTEFRKATVERPDFWKQLIAKVRVKFKGKLTYAANWDNYENISFWQDLDYIGIDAYFPVSSAHTPTIDDIISGWALPKRSLQSLSAKVGRPVLFTEYGYQSVDYAADGHWKHNIDTLQVNFQAQYNAYEGFYRALWKEPWIAGGFLWKWHLDMPLVQERMAKTYTPQNKPSQEVIRAWYKTTEKAGK